MIAPMVALAAITLRHRLRHRPLRRVPRPRGRVADARCSSRSRSASRAPASASAGGSTAGARWSSTRASARQRFGCFYGALAQKLYFDTRLRLAVHQAVLHALAGAARGLRPPRHRRRRQRRGTRMGARQLGELALRRRRHRRRGQRGRVACLGGPAAACAGCRSGRLQSYQRLVFSAVVVLMLCLVIYVVVKGA